MKNRMLLSVLNVLLVSLLFSPNVFSQATVVSVVPASVSSPRVGQLFTVDIDIRNGRNVAGFQVMLHFNFPAIEYVRMEPGDYLPADAFYGDKHFMGGHGTVLFAATASPHERNGNGTLARLTFKINEVKASTFRLSEANPSKPRGTILSDKDLKLSFPRTENADVFHGKGAFDLVVESPRVSDTTVGPGDEFTLTATVRNQGGGITPGILLFYYRSTDPYISKSTDTQVDGRSLSSLGANRSDTVSRTLTAPTAPGVYYYGACASSPPGEADPHNNCSEGVKVTVAQDTPEPIIPLPPELIELISGGLPDITGPPKIEDFTIGPEESKPDLVIEEMWANPTTVASGDKFKIYATVKNRGTGRSSATTVRYYHSDDAIISTRDRQIGKDDANPLAADGTVTGFLEVTAPTTPGIYHYGVCVDRIANESNTGNNCYEDPVSVRVTERVVGLEVPLDIISEMAFGPNSTYFILKAQFPKLTGVSGEVSYGKCTITLDLEGVPSDPVSLTDRENPRLDNPGYFMYWLKSPRQQIATATNDLAVESAVDLVAGGLGQISGALGVIINLSWNLGRYTGEVPHILQSTADPVIDLDPSNFGDGTGHPGGTASFICVARRRMNSVRVKIEQKYKIKRALWFDSTRTATFNRRFSLTSGTFTAPSAQPMSLSDYPPFRMLSPETQEYLLQHLGEFVNAEAWQIPEQSALLVNYPNPFNPETWIPYQLAEPADVALTIYDIHGRVVRDLNLGHQGAGLYQSKSRAAYWDGRNAQGESVASGVYFYTLKAGDFTATRKMLIRK